MVHFELKKSLWFCFFPAKLTSPKSTGLKQPSSIAHDFVDQVYKKGSLQPAALTKVIEQIVMGIFSEATR